MGEGRGGRDGGMEGGRGEGVRWRAKEDGGTREIERGKEGRHGGREQERREMEMERKKEGREQEGDGGGEGEGEGEGGKKEV